jgi:WD40 repeat protein
MFALNKSVREAPPFRVSLPRNPHAGSVMSVAWSADGERILTGSADHTAKVRDAASGEPLVTLSGHAGWVMSVAWSADGQRILTGSDDRTARVWLMPDALLAVALSRVQRDPPDFTPEEKVRYGIEGR